MKRDLDNYLPPEVFGSIMLTLESFIVIWRVNMTRLEVVSSRLLW
jgi:hypothetical protein